MPWLVYRPIHHGVGVSRSRKFIHPGKASAPERRPWAYFYDNVEREGCKVVRIIIVQPTPKKANKATRPHEAYAPLLVKNV
ncbi:putative radical SAM protein [Anopheles sinensis]|uniref:Putative radical SAM protein n=1 Tax=Anopheles sinensis TaxID=74873 RepID=A0A084WM14_ANOSI|nr:putative radical SAM protein [Anopheles sinensis]